MSDVLCSEQFAVDYTSRVFIDANRDAHADHSFAVTSDPTLTLQATDFVL